MKRLNIKSIACALLLSLSLISCGGGNEGGGSASSGSNSGLTSNVSQGTAGEIVSVDQFVSAVSNGQFSQASNAGAYRMVETVVDQGDWFSSSSSNYIDERRLNSDGDIQRTFSSSDSMWGDSLQEIKSNLVSYINSALSSNSTANPTIQKVQMNGYSYVETGAYVSQMQFVHTMTITVNIERALRQRFGRSKLEMTLTLLT